MPNPNAPDIVEEIDHKGMKEENEAVPIMSNF